MDLVITYIVILTLNFLLDAMFSEAINIDNMQNGILNFLA